MMVTGDYHHTAIAVARGAGMIPKGNPMLIIQAKSESDSLLAKQGQSPAVEALPPQYISTKSGSVSLTDWPDFEKVTRGLPASATTPALVLEPPVAASQLEVVNQGVTKAWGQEDVCLTFTLDSQGHSVNLDPVQALTSIAQVSSSSHA